MRSIVVGLSRLVRQRPVLVIVGVLLLTVLAGAGQPLAPDPNTGGEGFAPDTPSLDANTTIGERFGGSGAEIVQVLIEGDQDLISAAGVQAVAQLRDTITRVAGPNLLQQPQQPPIATFLDPVLQAVEQQGLDPAQLDDATVDQLYRQSLEQLPAEQAGLVAGLLPEGVEPAAASANSGLALVFLDPDSVQGGTSEMGAGPLLEVEQDMASAVEDLQLPGGVEADLFAFNLLLGDQDDFLDEVARLFAFAFLIILVILLFVFALRPRGGSALGAARRTLADVGLTLVVIILAIVWVQGFTGWLGPDGLGLIGAPAENSQILPVLLIGLGVDYAIHLTSRYREEIGQGYGVADAVGRATRTVGVALVLATATTAVGFLTNLVTPVPAIADFGVLAAVGIVAAFLLMLTLVPATRLLLDRRAERRGTLPRAACAATGDRALPGLMARLAVLAERAPVITLLVFVLGGGAVGVVGLLNLEASFSFTDFVPEGDPVVATFETLQDEFGGGFGETTDVLIDGDVATPATHNALVGALGETADVDNVITFGEQAAADSPVSVLGQVLAAAQQGGPGDGAPGQEGAPGGAAGAGLDPAAVSQVAQLAQQAGVGPDLRVDEGADVVALYEALLQAAPGLASQVLPEGELDVARVSIRTQAGEDDAGELADDLNEVFAPVEDAAGEVVPTSQSIISDDIVTALQSSQLVSLAVSVIAAMVLLVANFWFESRRPMLGVLTIAPVALVVMWTFAAMAFTGIPFGPVTATIAALAIGIGVPYTIHVTHRFQEDRLRYASAEEAIRSTVRHTGGALAGSAFTTIAGFGILVTSSLTPFRQFGLVTAFAIGFALLAATIVLPSLLVLWDRWHRRRGDLEGRAVETGDGESSAVERTRLVLAELGVPGSERNGEPGQEVRSWRERFVQAGQRAVGDGEAPDRSAVALAVIRGQTGVREAADRHGVPVEVVKAWRDRFLDAGTAVLVDADAGTAVLVDADAGTAVLVDADAGTAVLVDADAGTAELEDGSGGEVTRA